MDGFRCPNCDVGTVEGAPGRGRRMRFRELADLPVPDDLLIPTCGWCGEEWVDREATERIDAAMEEVYWAAHARRDVRVVVLGTALVVLIEVLFLGRC